MKMFIGQLKLEIRLFSRSLDDLFWTMLFPIFFIFLYGLIYRDTIWEEFGIKAIDYTMPGILVMALMVTGIMATATGFIEDRQKGIYRRLSLTPLKKYTIIASQITHRYVVMIIQTLLIILIGVLVFNVSFAGNYLLLWFVVTLGAVCFLSIGFLLVSFIKNARAATPVCMIVFFILLFLGGIFFPLSIMPNFLELFTRVLPSTHLNNALRMIAIDGLGISFMWKELLIIGGWIIATLALSIKFFKWE
jgi:ABC-2 type transport system permease protein